MAAEASKSEVTPESLTEALRGSGALAGGRVVEVGVETSRQTILSTIDRLRPRYEGGAGPATLIRKTPRGDVSPDLAEILHRERDFYVRVAPLMRAGLVPRCYGVAPGEPGSRWLLLEDLTESHSIVSEWPVPPTVEQCERIMDAFAELHGSWWNDPRLGTSVGTWLDAGMFERHLTELPRRVAAFVDRLGDRLSADRRGLYERLLHAAPRLLERYGSHRDLTIVHGDAHVWNLFYPRDPAGAIRLFDWDGWRVDVATDDLAYMMAVHWYPERRRALERPLLERYHAALLARGVAGYPFEALLDDYRLSVLWQIATPVWQASLGLGAWIWWSHFERIMLAVDDLDCRALLG